MSIERSDRIERMRRVEQVIGDDNSVPVAILKSALQQSSSVGLIVDGTPTNQPLGTGVIIGDGLLLTNYHVLPDPDQAASAKNSL